MFNFLPQRRGAATQTAAAETGCCPERCSRPLQESPPGGPTSRQPLGILAPRLVYLSGDFRKSTTSVSSSFAPSQPCKRVQVGSLSSTKRNQMHMLQS